MSDQRDPVDRLGDMLRTTVDVMKKIEVGEAPTEADLEGTPILRSWRRSVHPYMGIVCLEGIATGHPRLGDGWVITSPLVAIDPDGQWARTLSRWYRLSEPGAGDRGGKPGWVR